MDILFCTSEVYPLIKTGGLADISGSLPKALRRLNHDIRLALPAYPTVLQRLQERPAPLGRLRLTGHQHPVHILKSRLPDSDVPLYLVDAPALFDRPGDPYTRADGSDWPDNAERFALFARACVELALGRVEPAWRPQVVHCNDWQTGLVPVLLSQQAARPATLFTIHNLAYQGLFPAATFAALQLPDTLWSIDGLEFYNRLSFIKGGIANADWITTVSPTYAREIRREESGFGLAGLLRHRADTLSGILNGVDDDTWNPLTDHWIARRYDVHTLQNKLFNKLTLQRDHALPVSAQPMLLAFVGRLVEQKGVDLLLDILDALLRHPLQLVVLGRGDHALERQLRAAARCHPGQLAVYIGYNEQLAHRIEAGADALLMPSRFEPCGLNQIYSQMYGTVPIVRRTGGLADTVIDFSAATLADHTATGFCFDEDSPEALLATCLGALSLYRNQRIDWWKLAIAGMQRDFSWAASAARYSELYQRLGQRTDGPRQPLSLEQLGGLPTDTGSRPNAQRLH